MNDVLVNCRPYTKCRFDVENEKRPGIAFFRTYKGEQHTVEPQERGQGFIDYSNEYLLSDFDKQLLCEIALFGSGFCLSKILKERLAMKGITVSDNVFDSAAKRLHRYRLVDFSRIVSADGAIIGTRLISLTQFGSNMAKKLGIPHRFNKSVIETITTHEIKAYGQGVQLLTNIQKNLPVEYFMYRPVIAKDPAIGAIVRPTLFIQLCGEEAYCEVVRRYDGWQNNLLEKLFRYELSFGAKNPQTVIINGEDEEMCREISQLIKEKNYSSEFIFTDDMASFGNGFKYCFYNFDENGNRIWYEFCIDGAGEKPEVNDGNDVPLAACSENAE